MEEQEKQIAKDIENMLNESEFVQEWKVIKYKSVEQGQIRKRNIEFIDKRFSVIDYLFGLGMGFFICYFLIFLKII